MSRLVPRADVVRGLRHGAAVLGEHLPRVGAQLDEVVGERHEGGHRQRRGEERHVAELHRVGARVRVRVRVACEEEA